MPNPKELISDPNLPPWEKLKLIMTILRGKGGCSWDRKQDHKSMLPYLIEETYEVVEAIENDDADSLREELGDLLCQIVFHGQMATEAGKFKTDDVVESIINKLIHRHPHVFGEHNDLTPKQVRDQWERIKINSGEKKSVLSGLPGSMPALTMAFRIGEKAGGVGFDWKDPQDVMAKLEEELLEIQTAVESTDKNAIADEIGDLLFATASLARKLDIDPERALKTALEKFRTRFASLEAKVSKSGKRFENYSLDELEDIWQQIKRDNNTP